MFADVLFEYLMMIFSDKFIYNVFFHAESRIVIEFLNFSIKIRQKNIFQFYFTIVFSIRLLTCLQNFLKKYSNLIKIEPF